MPLPKDTLWSRDDHTAGKHLVLRNYLNAWYPILGRFNGRILFIDGFAGPGRYADGESGSPVVALQTLLEHKRIRHVNAEFVFVFIEKRKDRCKYLEGVIQEWRPKLPKSCKVHVVPGAFTNELSNILDLVNEQNDRLAPAFVMIDPFGISDTPMSLIERLLGNDKCEVYISFMYEAINRFKTTPEFENHLNSLYGCPEWKHGLRMVDPMERKDFFYGLYENQLKKAGARYVVRFELYQGNRLVYAIFFATSSTKGCDRMKEAIWKVDPFGSFAFRGTRSPQLALFATHPNTEPLKEVLTDRFAHRGFIPIEAIQEFVRSDETDYYSGQLKKLTLVPMEEAGLIEADESTRKRKNSYPPGCRIQFM